MGTHAKIEVYDDYEHVCTYLRTMDGGEVPLLLSNLCDRSRIVAHMPDQKDYYNIGEFPFAIGEALRANGYENYVKMIPQTDEDFEVMVRVQIPGMSAWAGSGFRSNWISMPRSAVIEES